MVLAGKPLRIAELETSRSVQARAAEALAALGPAEVGRLSFMIETAGLRVGRLDIDATGAAGLERWGPPIDQRHSWRFDMRPGHWLLELEQVEVSSSYSIRLECDGAAMHARVLSGEAGAKPTETTISLPSDGVILDPISVALANHEVLAKLEVGESLALDLAETAWRGASIVVGIRSIKVSRLAPKDSPLPGPATARNYAISEGKDAALGWLIVDASGPIRAAIRADEGFTEYLRFFTRAEGVGGSKSDAIPQPAPRTAP
jgi:hypothetical protein